MGAQVKSSFFSCFLSSYWHFQLESAVVHGIPEGAVDLGSEVEETEVRHRESQFMVLGLLWMRRRASLLYASELFIKIHLFRSDNLRILPPNAIETNWLFWFYLWLWLDIIQWILIVAVPIHEYFITINHIDSSIFFFAFDAPHTWHFPPSHRLGDVLPLVKNVNSNISNV